ncbi:MAG: hypothetical protein A3J40_04805 [Erythrobacter sp. RIFCSPHIGHO2_12_FULL_63_10]|nr:MAG: hypothetical protein A3J40_04805 [Erythrobacter sp. RIFCSPHIGHO2_12_FULL_63_10]
MSTADRLEKIYAMFLGASLAFFFCHFVWKVEGADNAAFVTVIVWVIAFFLSRYLRKKDVIAHG